MKKTIFVATVALLLVSIAGASFAGKIVYRKSPSGEASDMRYEKDAYVLKADEHIYPGDRMPVSPLGPAHDLDALHDPAFLAARSALLAQEEQERSVERAVFKAIFALTNRVLALEGKPPLTRQQFVDWATK